MSDFPGSYSGSYPVRPDLWLHALTIAESEKDVVAAVRDHLATWTPMQISRIPESCRPEKIVDAQDVTEFAFRVSQAHLTYEGRLVDRMLLERLMSFLTHACERIAQLQTVRPVVPTTSA